MSDPKPDVCLDCHCRIFGGITPDGEDIKLEAVTKVYKWNPKTQAATEVKAGVAGTMVLADHLPRCTEMQRLQKRVKDLMDLTGGVVADESVIPQSDSEVQAAVSEQEKAEVEEKYLGNADPDDPFSGWED